MTLLTTPGMPRPRSVATVPHGRWGMYMLITTEAIIFAALLSSYFFLRATADTWPQGDIRPPELGPISIFTALLLASSAPLVWAEKAVRRGRIVQLRIALALSFVMGLAFIVNQVSEMSRLEFDASDNAYASAFIVITGLHGLHLLAGLLISAVVQVQATLHRFDADHHETVRVFAMYWHFVDVVWIFVFSSLYLSVRW